MIRWIKSYFRKKKLEEWKKVMLATYSHTELVFDSVQRQLQMRYLKSLSDRAQYLAQRLKELKEE